MSDFLTRLAQRAVGGASSGLEPVREPVFPVDPPMESAMEGASAFPPPMTPRGARPAPHVPARVAEGSIPDPPSAGPIRTAPAAAPPMGDKRQAHDARPEPDRSASVPLPVEPDGVSVRHAQRTLTPPGRGEPRQRQFPDPLSPIAPPTTTARPVTRPRQQPAKEPVSPHSPVSPPLRPVRTASPEKAASAPAPVTVRIGRVDVRANIAPAPPAPAERKPERTPALGLKEYLERRHGGRR